MDKTKPALVLPITITLGESAVTKDTIEALPPIRFIGDTADRLLQACQRERLLKGQFTLHVRTIGSFGFSGTAVLQAAFNRAHKEGLLLCEPELVVRLLQAPGMIVRPGRVPFLP